MLNFNALMGDVLVINIPHLNTSHVKLQRGSPFNCHLLFLHLNTSHVKLQQAQNKGQ